MELRYTLSTATAVPAVLGVTCELSPRYNVAAGQHAPVMRGAREIVDMRWGLLPRWRGHGGKRGQLVHMAPLEAIAGTPLLRDAFKKQRCLILADGCFAWRDLKQPVWFHPDPPRPIAYAGVWAESDDGIPSFAMLVGAPSVTRVKHPMPIVVDPEAYDAYLDPDVPPARAEALLGDAPVVEGWRADAVSTWMSSAQHDDPRCIEPLGNPAQGELFG